MSKHDLRLFDRTLIENANLPNAPLADNPRPAPLPPRPREQPRTPPPPPPRMNRALRPRRRS